MQERQQEQQVLQLQAAMLKAAEHTVRPRLIRRSSCG